MIQWFHVPPGASGSSMIRAKLFVSGGSPDQRKGGEMSLPSHVNRLGIAAPSAKPSIVSWNDIPYERVARPMPAAVGLKNAHASVVEPHWEHFAHGADIGVRGIAMTKAEAFEQAAVALTAVLTNPLRVRASREVVLECQAGDSEALLVEWLNALVYEMAVRGMIFGRFAVRLEANRLHGSAWGEDVDIARHEPAVEVKGATYTSLFVGQNADGAWVAQCVVDV